MDSRAIERLKRERNAIRELTRGSITLSQAVHQAGGQLTLDATPNPDYFRLADVESLTRESPFVVVASRRSEPRVQLSDDERSIVTRYDMEVESVIRSPHAKERLARLTVEVPGGRLTLKEGNAAVVNGPTLRDGEKYTLYLQAKNPPPTAGQPLPRAGANRVFVVTGSHYEGIRPIDQ
jgi:hypothetical protein